MLLCSGAPKMQTQHDSHRGRGSARAERCAWELPRGDREDRRRDATRSLEAVCVWTPGPSRDPAIPPSSHGSYWG